MNVREESVACLTCNSATRVTAGGQCQACDVRRMRLLQLVTRAGVLGAASVDGAIRQYEGATEWLTFVTASADLAAQASGEEVELRVAAPGVAVFLTRRGGSTIAVAVEPGHAVVKVLRRVTRSIWWPKRGGS